MSIKIIQSGFDAPIPLEVCKCPHCGLITKQYNLLPIGNIGQNTNTLVMIPTFACSKCLCIWQWIPDNIEKQSLETGVENIKPECESELSKYLDELIAEGSKRLTQKYLAEKQKNNSENKDKPVGIYKKLIRWILKKFSKKASLRAEQTGLGSG